MFSLKNQYNLRSNKKQSIISQNIIIKNTFFKKLNINSNYNTDLLKIIKSNNISDKFKFNTNILIECMDYTKYHDKEFINECLKKIVDSTQQTQQTQQIEIILFWILCFDHKKLDKIPILISKYNLFDFNFLNFDYDKKVKVELEVEEKFLINNDSYTFDNTWVSASKTRNYLLNDPLIDYLEYNKIYESEQLTEFYGNNLTNTNTNTNTSITTKITTRKRKLSFSNDSTDQIVPITFLDTLFNNGKQFETLIIDDIKKKFPSDIITILDISDYNYITYKNISDPIFFEMTKQAIKKGIPIIYQGVLHNTDNKSFGLPDLIVRSDYLNKLFDQPIELNDKILKSTKQLPYYIIDIKNSNMHLSANSDNVLNNIGTKPFKGQIAVYHQIISNVQNHDTNKAFILASKWSRKQKDNIYICTNPFDRAGILNFSTTDSVYIKDANAAINWIQLIKQPNNKLNCLDTNHDNLYPNMKNMTDGKYHKVKKFLADRNHEITNIWKCGIKNRTKAFAKGIKKWSDKQLNSSVLGINGKDSNIINKMLDLNRSISDIIVIPEKINSTFNDWRDKNKLAFYLDFETVNESTFEVKEWSETEINGFNSNDLIFMIGIGYSINNEWYYKSFIVKNLTENEQKDIIHKMFNFIRKICDENGYSNTLYQDINIYHWSNFEQTILTKLCTKHNIILPIYKWTDILKIFHEEPILVKGALNFSLKSIGKALYDNKLIDVYWEDSDCKSGLDAMFQAYQIYSLPNSIELTKTIYDNEKMKIINRYNEVDCKIMWAILNYLRNNH
jgi:hypothetical protein